MLMSYSWLYRYQGKQGEEYKKTVLFLQIFSTSKAVSDKKFLNMQTVIITKLPLWCGMLTVEKGIYLLLNLL